MKALKITLALLLSYTLFAQAYSANVESIDVINGKNINIVFDTGTLLPEGEIDSDIKVLKDIAISFASKDLVDEFKLILDLNGELEKNSKYSLLSILGPEGNIDFTLGDSIDGLEVLNDILSEGQGINKIVIKDSKTIELFYNTAIVEDEFEFKLLSESTISGLTAFNGNTISVGFENELKEYSNYILMLLSVKDRFGAEVTFDEDLHDFITETLIVVQEEIMNEGDATLDEPTTEITEIPDTNEKLVEDTAETESNLEEISLNAAATPDTGAATWVLLMLTFIMNTCIFFRKKLIKA